ncbi:MAG TPA: hypothetical protein VLA48_06620 [Nitrososphaeraceae archaeon]|nr:hypothetical protein [Nitrososphaeraceae archaeon]
MQTSNFEHDDRSMYSDEEYEQLGKYGKEILVSHNSNDSYANNSVILVVDEEELRSKIPTDDFVEYVFKTVKKTVKCEDVLIRQIIYTGLSSYIEDDHINLGILAPTSEGKTYPVAECMKYFPKQDIYKVGSMSAKVLVREKGRIVDGNLNPIEDKIKELKKAKKRTNDEEEKEIINDEIEKLYEDAKTLIDWRGKILVFLEPPTLLRNFLFLTHLANLF